MLHFQLSKELPLCSKCGARMNHASLIPGLSGISSRAFECARCGNIELAAEQRAATR